MTRRIHFAALATVLAISAQTPAAAASFSLRYIGEQRIATGTLFEGVEFGGISGLDYDASTGRYYALADDRGGERGTPRFYTLSLDYDALGFNGVTIHDQRFMQRPDGTTFPATSRTVDPEGLRIAPNGNLYWSSEGNWSSNAAQRFQPFVREMGTDGVFVREFDTPAQFDYVDNATTGGRNNKLFEALAVTPNGTVVTANEDALVQDGPITSLVNGSVVRVMTMDPATGLPLAQYAYELPPIPKAPTVPPPNNFADNGLPELLALSDTEFLAVERGFANGVGNTIRLVLTSTAGATDVSNMASLVGASYVPMSKELIIDLDSLGITLDNSEALSFGLTLTNGNRTLVLASDNNFNATQFTQFLAFEVTPVPVPAALPLFAGGLAALGFARRRRRG
jgi:hypothetical protein